MSSIVVLVSGRLARSRVKYLSRSQMEIIFSLKSDEFVNERSRSFKSGEMKLGIADSPALDIRKGLRLGFTRRRIAEQVSALFTGELQTGGNIGAPHHEIVL
jgi:hypothetical protein